jgi:hypothetical protein
MPLEKGSPVGTFDNSPAIYRWEPCSYIILVPQGRLKTGDYSTDRWQRPASGGAMVLVSWVFF